MKLSTTNITESFIANALFAWVAWMIYTKQQHESKENK